MSLILLKDEYAIDCERTTRWNVLSGVSVELTAVWNILSGVSKEWIAKWDVQSYLSKEWSSVWNIASYLSREFSALWNIRTVFAAKAKYHFRLEKTITRFTRNYRGGGAGPVRSIGVAVPEMPVVPPVPKIGIEVSEGQISFVGYGPILSHSDQAEITPPAGQLALAGYAPDQAISGIGITPPAGQLSLVGSLPTIGISVQASITPGTAQLSMVGQVPTALHPVEEPPSIPSVPDAPSALVAEGASESQIDLSWQDNSANETGFAILRGISPGAITYPVATVGAGVTVYSDTGLPSGTTFYYIVKAYNAAGFSNPSNVASASTLTPGEWSEEGGFTTE